MNKTRAPKIYFITYGDQKYSISKRHLIGLAKHSKFFDHSISFGPKDIDNSFKTNNLYLLNPYLWKKK